MALRIEKDGQRWRVTGEGPNLESINLYSTELDTAAWQAIEMGLVFGLGQPSLGEGVPDDALEGGLRMKEIIDHYRSKAR
jgi:hypothetical protein